MFREGGIIWERCTTPDTEVPKTREGDDRRFLIAGFRQKKGM